MTIPLEQALTILEHRQQQMLAFQQQLLETVLDKFFNNGAKMAVPEERQVEGSIPFISDGKCKIGKLAGSEQDNILLNAHETVTVSDVKEKQGSVDKALSPESNEAPLNPPISEDKLQSELNYGLHDIGQESWNGAHDFDENSYEDEETKSVESNADQKPKAISLDDDSPSYQISSSENLNEFDGDVSEKPNSDDLKSNIVHHHLFISSGFCIQYEKCVLNKVILIVNWRYEDPTLFRGGGNVGEFQPTDNFFKIRI
ncbi:unnamed protein product [Schistosoma mansoni]|uniref:Smp_205600 n=1 Tax=Schistosoma mansoni TaxID=6183 RepID=UPI00022C853C|nr:unnamed protein product [Schistosoma mansoni]|eukprot:XP_018644749.1 unnamed protein product [Schistosoma mansoni]